MGFGFAYAPLPNLQETQWRASINLVFIVTRWTRRTLHVRRISLSEQWRIHALVYGIDERQGR